MMRSHSSNIYNLV